jgi:hypothetical protein
MMREVLEGKGEIPFIVIVSVSVAGTLLLLLNIVLISVFVHKKRSSKARERKGGEGSGTPSSEGRFSDCAIVVGRRSTNMETITNHVFAWMKASPHLTIPFPFLAPFPNKCFIFPRRGLGEEKLCNISLAFLSSFCAVKLDTAFDFNISSRKKKKKKHKRRRQ